MNIFDVCVRSMPIPKMAPSIPFSLHKSYDLILAKFQTAETILDVDSFIITVTPI